MAKKAGATAGDATAAEAEIDRRLAAAGGGPLAFSVPASALYDAMGDTPGVSLKTLSHRTDGTLPTTLAAPRVEDLNQVLLALQARGYRITAQPKIGRAHVCNHGTNAHLVCRLLLANKKYE